MKKLLTIDSSNDNHAKKLFGRPPLLSVNQAIKSDILKINLLELPSGFTSKNKSNYHSVLIGYNQLEIEMDIGGLSQVGKFKSNHSIIIPANCQNCCSWNGAANCLIFAFESELLDRTCYELTSSYSSRLLPTLPQMDGMIYEIASKIQSHIQDGKFLSQNYVDSLGSMFMNHLGELYCINQTNQIIIHPFSRNELNIINSYILDRSHSELKIQDLSELFDISLPYFEKRIKVTTGLPAHQYLNKIRLQKAMEYLKNTNKKIPEVAKLCNFGSSDTLRRLLRKQKNKCRLDLGCSLIFP
jgi:AraC-like DNA-binding protein